MSEFSSAPVFKRAHFIGIGGAGMSGIALVLHGRGCCVTGSDLKSSRYVRELERAGIKVYVGHEAATIDTVAPDVVVVSSAIPPTNPELVRAHEQHIAVWQRAKMLAALAYGRTTIAISGTHGKTTTSSMVATMLDHMGLDPAFLIGGVVEEYGTNGRDGSSKYFVAEADESDGSFLFLDPTVALITNVESDHLDHYDTLENLESTFCKFMSSVGASGHIVVCGDSDHVVEFARSTGHHVVTYGFSDSCDYVCVPQASTHTLTSLGTIRTPENVTLPLKLTANPGCHNLLNATGALASAAVLGLDVKKAAEALSSFKGVRRRFTHIGMVRGITVVDDYGHHPTEVAATLAAASELRYKRIVVVFQPHRYSRTQVLASEFADVFSHADMLYVMDVFSAGECPIPGISGKVVAEAVRGSQTDAPAVAYVPSRRTLLARLVAELQAGDLLITMGAGDVTLIGPDFIAACEEADNKERRERL